MRYRLKKIGKNNLQKGGNPDDDLIDAVDDGNLNEVKRLLEAGISVRAKKNLALQKASYYGLLEIVKLLLKAGANVHANNDEALRYASFYGHS
jgi:ankyrin repeat protein